MFGGDKKEVLACCSLEDNEGFEEDTYMSFLEERLVFSEGQEGGNL